jgi:aspartyl-tRNA(Asn)/glutamyl-tRNA(Gln) amidotransferase subunit C
VLKEDDIRKLALLARLELSDAEVRTLGPQVQGILAFVEQLAAVDTSGVEPMTTALDVDNRWRPDQNVPSLDRDRALANAPQRDDQFFLVPPVLGPTDSPVKQPTRKGV